MPNDLVLLLSNFPSRDVARTVVVSLVEEHLVACGTMLPQAESIYSWKGEIEHTVEVMVVFKTTVGRAQKAIARIKELHPYEVPEILQIPIEGGWPAYLAWVSESVRPVARS